MEELKSAFKQVPVNGTDEFWAKCREIMLLHAYSASKLATKAESYSLAHQTSRLEMKDLAIIEQEIARQSRSAGSSSQKGRKQNVIAKKSDKLAAAAAATTTTTFNFTSQHKSQGSQEETFSFSSTPATQFAKKKQSAPQTTHSQFSSAKKPLIVPVQDSMYRKRSDKGKVVLSYPQQQQQPNEDETVSERESSNVTIELISGLGANNIFASDVHLSQSQSQSQSQSETQQTQSQQSRKLGSAANNKFLYMYDKFEDKADKIAERLAYFGEKILRHYNLVKITEEDDNSNSETATQQQQQNNANDDDNDQRLNLLGINTISGTEGIFVGRVVCDSDTGEGRLNKQSILLEGLTEDGSDSDIVALDLDDVDQYSIFPGQIIAVRGTNFDGRRIKASQCYLGATPPYADQSDSKNHNSNNESSIKIIVAAGPFCTEDNLAYEPLNDLITAVNKQLPNVLVLIGPFVDANHPLIDSGDSLSTPELEDATYDDIFRESVVQRVQQTVNPSVEIVWVPSVRDVNHHFVFPQPSFSLLPETALLDTAADLFDHRSVCLPNPAMIRVKSDSNSSEMTIGVTSLDVIKALAKEELSKKNSPERLARLAEHIINQQCFYPVFRGSEEVPLDYAHSSHLNIEHTPSILLTPSDMQYFVKEITSHRTLCINPRRLATENTGGTYAVIYWQTQTAGSDGDDQPMTDGPASLADRLRVDIVKI